MQLPHLAFIGFLFFVSPTPSSASAAISNHSNRMIPAASLPLPSPQSAITNDIPLFVNSADPAISKASASLPTIYIEENDALTMKPFSLKHAWEEKYAEPSNVPSLPYRKTDMICANQPEKDNERSTRPELNQKCLRSALSAQGIDIKNFGAKCDGVTDDARAINAALSYAAATETSEVVINGTANCVIGSTLTVGAGVTLKGNGLKSTNRGLAAGAANLNPMIMLNGLGASLRDLTVNASAAGPATGTVIRVSPSSQQVTMRNIYITGSCGALDLNGSLHRVENFYAYNSEGSQCNVISIGSSTAQAGSVDNKLDHVVVTSVNSDARPASCFMIYDAGGLFITHSDAIYCQVGTSIAPKSNQQVIWTTFADTYLGDTNGSTAFTLDATAPSAAVKGLNCNACWASSSSGDGIIIQNTGGGTVTTLTFTGLRSLGNAGNAISIETNANLRVTASTLCGYGENGVYAGKGIGEIQITNSTIRPDCAGLSSKGQFGIFLSGQNKNITLSNIDARDNKKMEIYGIPSGNSFVRDITSINNTSSNIASASSITLDTVHLLWKITGKSTISYIGGGWEGRSVTFISSNDPISFQKGRNICSQITSKPNEPVFAIYTDSCWYLK
ncbi:glycosyl hydrolase family 28-related protein [Novosphingobium rosa]|uniref:glycosyl hydrolase family 28-related protein n=1 Tax=Novosphingobium rosa TaxID=76978 RepID=UPI000B135812|nr:glycosyl hydrolase family 28-related protein [Novosphingobium rosa]